MTLIIRKPRDEDTKELKELFLITRRKTFTLQLPEKFQLDDYDESVAGEEVWVAEKDGVIAGFVSIWLQDNFIHNLFVHPNWQGQGIGVHLLKIAEEHLECPMELKVKTENLRACKFYQKHGWQEEYANSNANEPYFSYKKYTKDENN